MISKGKLSDSTEGLAWMDEGVRIVEGGGELFTESLLGAGCWRCFLEHDSPTFQELGSLQLSFDGNGRVKTINLLPT